MIDSLVWLLLLPLAWATLAFVLGPGRGAWLAIAGLAAQFALDHGLVFGDDLFPV